VPSTIPKPRRHLPRSRELECPVCGQAHTPFSCVPAEQAFDAQPLIVEIEGLLERVDKWNPGWERMSATYALLNSKEWLEKFQRIAAEPATSLQEVSEKDRRG
jgi:C4-type Zn-finger protein